MHWYGHTVEFSSTPHEDARWLITPAQTSELWECTYHMTTLQREKAERTDIAPGGILNLPAIFKHMLIQEQHCLRHNPSAVAGANVCRRRPVGHPLGTPLGIPASWAVLTNTGQALLPMPHLAHHTIPMHSASVHNSDNHAAATSNQPGDTCSRKSHARKGTGNT
jgi:hypothetical protein